MNTTKTPVKWVPLNTALPTVGQKVLITNGKVVTAAEYRGGEVVTWYGCELSGYEWDWEFDEDSITHWAELPDVPSKETKNE